MGYFSAVLAEPEAQVAGRMSLDDLLKRNVVGGGIWSPLASQLGISDWQIAGGTNESGAEVGSGIADPAKLQALQGYTFDWQDTGPENTGTLKAYDPSGNLVGTFNQQDQSFGSALGEWAALAAAGFGGAALAGFGGPLGGLLGGAGGAGQIGSSVAGAGADAAANLAAYGGTLTPAQVAGTAAFDLGAGTGLGAAGTAGGISGGGLTLGGSTYGTIGANSAALGAGGAGLSSGVGLTAPAFAGGGTGIAGGLGMTAGAGTAASGGLSGLLGSLQGYLPAAQSLASIASGVYGMKLAGDAREASDPFAPYRGAYAQKLAALEANPGSIVSRPGFQAGLETIGRKSAASGYYGSGNMASALSRYSGDFYNQEATRLASLAGAGQTPGAGQALGADLASQSLGAIGYGLGPLLTRLTQGG